MVRGDKAPLPTHYPTLSLDARTEALRGDVTVIDSERLKAAYRMARDDLLAERCAAGHWVGELSSSALSTATAVSALALAVRHGTPAPAGRLDTLVRAGLDWLMLRQNADGGWGDTDRSLSNIATTMLVRAAAHLAGTAQSATERLQRAEAYINRQGGVEGLCRRYGQDKTFAVPILTNCALAGLTPWSKVAPLPFELACLPYPLLRFLQLPVVSYAVPALVAIGQARYFHGRPSNPLTWFIRATTVERSLQTLIRMQPDSGGFLEAIPLTSFVVMSLAATDRAGHVVVRRGVQFLQECARSDGSWPIDTDLATWNTTLALNALAEGGEPISELGCLPWLLACQHRRVHPFTNASPGGWGWNDASGAVPDADDTSGALLALAAHGRPTMLRTDVSLAAQEAVQWLLDLQNDDGGWPTFCRGWGALPFDRSSVDITAHALRALARWRELATAWPARAAQRIDAGTVRALAHLRQTQRTDGSWAALWFGNQYRTEEENPVYGTARVLLAYRDLGRSEAPEARRGRHWLLSQQMPSGGWGPSPEMAGEDMSSVEETALATEALLAEEDVSSQLAATKGLTKLAQFTEEQQHRRPAPIGFYFARLWYYERLYPLVFAVSALGRSIRGM